MSFFPKRSVLAVLLLCGPLAFAQVAGSATQMEAAGQQELLDRIRAAYYHPGKVALSCDAALDFSSALTKLGDTAGAKAGEGLKMRVTASDSRNAEIAFAWPPKSKADDHPQVEESAKQVIGGFFQAYWPLANAEMVPPVKDHPVIAAVTAGGYTITTPTPGGAGTSRLVVDSNARVQRAETHTVAGKNSALTLSYTASPNPRPGDTMRLSGITVGNPTGSGQVLATMTWDDQDVNGIFLPRRVSVAIPGTFEVPFTLSNCTVAPDPGAR